jgi:crotonobetainyl-CoA:carnitine CoA-transferase CaiB-like acyl-CoA transferase
MVQEIRRPDAAPVRVVGPALKLSATPAQVRLPPPRLGEHTEDVLQTWLGYTQAEMDDMRRRGAI